MIFVPEIPGKVEIPGLAIHFNAQQHERRDKGIPYFESSGKHTESTECVTDYKDLQTAQSPGVLLSAYAKRAFPVDSQINPKNYFFLITGVRFNKSDLVFFCIHTGYFNIEIKQAIAIALGSGFKFTDQDCILL
jgi:hypothetical protein